MPVAARRMVSNGDGRSRRLRRVACTALVLCLTAIACGSEAEGPQGAPEDTAAAGSTGTPAAGATPEATAGAEAATEPAAQTEAAAATCEGAERFAGEQLEIGIPFGPGGYDRQGRIIAEALGRKYEVTP